MQFPLNLRREERVADRALPGLEGRDGNLGIAIVNREKDSLSSLLQVLTFFLAELLVDRHVDRLADRRLPPMGEVQNTTVDWS